MAERFTRARVERGAGGTFKRHGITVSRATRSSGIEAAAGSCERDQVERVQHSMVYGQRCDEVRGLYDVAFKKPKYHAGRARSRMVTHSQTLDVIVASNLSADIRRTGAAFQAASASPPAHTTMTQVTRCREDQGRSPRSTEGDCKPIGAIWAGPTCRSLGEHAATNILWRPSHSSFSGDTKTRTREERRGQNNGAAIQAAIDQPVTQWLPNV